MNAKITLYSETELIEKMKKYAKDHNTSLSKIVTRFFEAIIDQESSKQNPDAKITEKLHGIFKGLPVDESDYYKHLEKKYL